MKETWRWFGPKDAITLPQIAQTGAEGIVTALHDIPYGEVWTAEAITERKDMIEAADFTWDVVESLPIHEAIKKGEGDLTPFFENYRQSMVNLAAAGLKTICYNFMPLLDWTRTDLAAPVPRGGTCLRFSAPKMAAFEIHMLGREAAHDDYDPAVIAAATTWYEQSDEAARATLLNAIMAGLPGAFDRYTIPELREVLKSYAGIGRNDLRQNYKRFLDEVMPTAQELGMNFCVHPDDPPRDILGLPRIVSNGEDIDWIMKAYDAPENGLTLCSGSLGANPANDVPEIARSFGDRIHFAHLRNVRKDPDGSFQEDAHLTGDTDMVAVIDELLEAESRDGKSIPFRPDHGHDLLMDAGLGTQAGYPLIGRLRGLAELRGVITALS
ncbi:mannonate dehydratase [Yoonia sp. BS5-3]|uniref:Mannonate dehydratase n=1 Tax=Yoonia phaeophyticola TaxID=3137369 RepID=A0ABZ2V7E7_9RHOB